MVGLSSESTNILNKMASSCFINVLWSNKFYQTNLDNIFIMYVLQI